LGRAPLQRVYRFHQFCHPEEAFRPTRDLLFVLRPSSSKRNIPWPTFTSTAEAISSWAPISTAEAVIHPSQSDADDPETEKATSLTNSQIIHPQTAD
jgi:hypothetical protein